MKVAKIVFGLLGACATTVYLIELVGIIAVGDFSTRGISEIAAAVAALCIGALITFWLFQSAFRRR